MELLGSEYIISQHKRYISIARTGNFIMYALGPFSWKQSHLYLHVLMHMINYTRQLILPHSLIYNSIAMHAQCTAFQCACDTY